MKNILEQIPAAFTKESETVFEITGQVQDNSAIPMVEQQSNNWQMTFTNQAVVMPNNNPYGLMPLNPNPQLSFGEALKRGTLLMQPVIANHNARKAMQKIQQENQREAEIQRLVNDLRFRQLALMNLGPSLPNIEVDLQGVPKDMMEVAKAIAYLSGWRSLDILILLLGAVSISLHGRWKVKVHENWDEPIALYIIEVMPSGEVKTSVLKTLEKPFTLFIGKMQEKFRQQNHNVGRQKKLLNSALSKISTSRVYDILEDSESMAGIINYQYLIASIKELAEELLPIDEAKDGLNQLPRIFIDNTTTKKHARTLAAQGNCLAFFSDEDSLIKRLARYDSADAQLLLHGHTMGECSFESMTTGEVMLRNLVINILYIVQPEILRILFRNKHLHELGATSRFLPCFAMRQNKMPGDPALVDNKPVLEQYSAKVEAMLNRNYTQKQDREIYSMCLSPEAHAMIMSFMEETMNEVRSGCFDHMKAFLSKLRGTAVRIAGVLHAWQYDQPELYPISAPTMYTAISLARYLAHHAQYAFNPYGLTAFYEADTILKWVRRHGKMRFTVRDIAQGTGLKKEQIFPAIELLAYNNYMIVYVEPGISSICVMHPYFSTFTELNPRQTTF